MSVKIRLMRVGKKKQPTYRVVVTDSRSPRDGRIIETIGHYGPRHDPSKLDLDGEKALAWLRKGAQPSEQVQKLLAVNGVWATFVAEKGGTVVTKLNRRGFLTGKVTTTKGKKKQVPEAAAAPAAPAAPAAEASSAEAEAAPEVETPPAVEAEPTPEAAADDAPAADAEATPAEDAPEEPAE